jgi:polyisoprenoid-binding protein YceI
MIARRLLLPLLLFATAGAQAADWKVVPAGSSLRFSGTAQGEAFEGAFKRFEAKIAFDPAQLAGSRFEVTVDLASADTRNEERDGTLKEADFFDVAKTPKATYVADRFTAKGAGFEAQGTLTLRGVAKPVTLEFTWTPSAGGATLEGHATLDRSAFGVGGGDWADPEMIANEVKVATTLVLQPAS